MNDKLFSHTTVKMTRLKSIVLDKWFDEIQPISDNTYKINGLSAIWYANNNIKEYLIEIGEDEEFHFNKESEVITYAATLKNKYRHLFKTIDEFRLFIEFIDLQFGSWRYYFNDNIKPNQIIIYDVPFSNNDLDFNRMELSMKYYPTSFIWNLICQAKNHSYGYPAEGFVN